MFQAEEFHWWYRGMESITHALLARWYPPGASLRILDAGCGTGGAMAGCLPGFGQVTGFDLSPLALQFASRRGLSRLARASVTEVPFPNQAFDLVTSFDVLYERGVADDARAVREFSRILIPGGRLLMRLPACNWLRGRHDLRVHTARRYSLPQVADLIRQAGLALEHISHANTILFPAAVLVRTFQQLNPQHAGAPELRFGSGRLNGLLRALLASEAGLVSRYRLPFGLSIFVVGRKTA